QSFDVYTNQENFFTVNFPGTPTATQVTHKTLKGTELTAHVFTATVPPGARTSGTYSVTVVDFAGALDEMSTAVEHAADAIRAKGAIKYDAIENLDLHASRRLTVETATDRILAEILFAPNNRLYIVQAENSLTQTPPAQFQASLQIIDNAGARIRTRTLLGLPEGSKQPLNAGGIADEPDTVAALMSGSWRSAGGTCEAPYFKSGMRSKNSRGEAVMAGTITNGGTTINGMLIVEAARAGQFVDPVSFQALMLFDPMGDKLGISSIGGAAASWPDVTLELCPGSRT
ncbi:MAG TPA: hypothetical protein VGM72_12065, partial [Micropepsaceae bacterium]